MKIYCISGLGADWRAFQYLELPDHELVHIEWIEPIKGESLPAYARRLSEVVDTSEPFALMGLSLGGMMSVEITKLLNPKHTIVISSIERSDEFPRFFRILGALRLHRVVPASWLTSNNFISRYMFGVKSVGTKELFAQILHDTDGSFVKWAFGAMLSWKSSEAISCRRIHGTKDRIFPIGGMRVEHVVEGGGHLMIVDEAQAVSGIVCGVLS